MDATTFLARLGSRASQFAYSRLECGNIMIGSVRNVLTVIGSDRTGLLRIGIQGLNGTAW